jgi:Fe-S oxidoreductase
LHSGDLEQFTKIAAGNVATLAAEVRAGTDIVVPEPTCSYVLKHDYLAHVPGPDAEIVAEHTFDAAEYLMKVHMGEATSLDTSFHGDIAATVTYHAPCHLRAQKIGLTSRDLIKLTGSRVTVVQQCSGIDGMWGLRAGNEEVSIPIAEQLGEMIERAGANVVAGDCSLANVAIVEQTGRRAQHPIQVLARAYGIATEAE